MTNKEAINNLNHIYGILSPDIQRSIDVAIKALEERLQGEWIEVEPTEEDKEYGFDTRIVCSRCYEPDSHYDYDEYHKPKAVWYFRPKFCPNCGAKMKGRFVE